MTERNDQERIRIRDPYRGVAGMDRFCRETCNKSGPASVWRVFAFLWARDDKPIVHEGTGLSERTTANVLWTLKERRVLEIID